tara:strand:+ start:13 stop:294 length:282 start_codon:yes stop_codon:yes gene_type:complete
MIESKRLAIRKNNRQIAKHCKHVIGAWVAKEEIVTQFVNSEENGLGKCPTEDIHRTNVLQPIPFLRDDRQIQLQAYQTETNVLALVLGTHALP